MGPKF